MPANQRVQRIFSPILLAFIAVVVVLVGIVIYVAFSKTTIKITLRDVPSSVPFQYTTTELGVVPEVTVVDASFIYTDYVPTVTEDAVATGTVRLINQYSGDQPLVKTTRLLSTEGVLFRTNETVTVPAGGSVEVAVYADQPGEAGNISASKFEIVALDDSLKDQIYGESEQPMTGGIIQRVELTEEIVTAAKAAALVELTTADDATTLSDLTQVINGEVGETVDSVIVTTTGTITTVLVTSEQLLSQLQSEDQPVSVDSGITYELNQDGEEIIISGEADSMLTASNLDFIEPAALTNKTEQQIHEYLAQYEQVDQVEVHFVPFWIDTTPSLPQQIQLVQQ